MRFEQYLRESAHRHPAKTALVVGETRLSYQDLEARSQQFANSLAEHGVGRSDRVLIVTENSIETVVGVFGTLMAGATFSVINASTKAGKLAYIFGDCEPSAIVTSGRLVPVVSEALESCLATWRPVIFAAALDGDSIEPGVLSFEVSCRGSAYRVEHGGSEEDLAMLVYTSGSTGRPKGVMMTHRNVEAASASIISYLENTADDIIFNALPLAFDYGLYQLLMSVRIGATLVMEKSFAFPVAMFELMRRENVTGLPLVPTMAALILHMRDLAPNPVPSLRYITNTAAALPAEHIKRLKQLFPGSSLFSMYGLTECKRCTYLPPRELEERPTSVGIPIPGTEAYVVDQHGHVVAPGEIGELVVQGPHVMQGYWRNEAASERALRPGPNTKLPALHTGDLFKRDSEGFLYFVGRSDDIIKTRGEKVAPKEVEAVLHGHPDVVEAVVTGVADPILGQAVSALVVVREGSISERDLIRYCQRHLEDFMVPKHLSFAASLPKTETGKVSRRLAAEVLEVVR